MRRPKLFWSPVIKSNNASFLKSTGFSSNQFRVIWYCFNKTKHQSEFTDGINPGCYFKCSPYFKSFSVLDDLWTPKGIKAENVFWQWNERPVSHQHTKIHFVNEPHFNPQAVVVFTVFKIAVQALISNQIAIHWVKTGDIQNGWRRRCKRFIYWYFTNRGTNTL